ncbi:MAG: TIGR02281 family clan AA aspartic protease [Gammaproteobacteria bacterium]|nr:TIGR02281 family clan AA aspartic protease [Gammaproteobacteria bacterium]MDH5592456.1 TIGR02281 family clan AA aspartic protease [Gammaproteobacteria bacterium]
MNKAWIAGLIILLNASAVLSDELDVVIVGLFNDQAVIQINKQQHLLKVGNTSPEGVTLVSATSQAAVLEIDGVKKTYQLGKHISTNYIPAPAQPTVSLWPVNGMYLTTGSVNGFTVDFLVDTGASAIALNAKTATNLSLDYLKGPIVGVKTASGIEQAYQVNLDQVQVGDIKLYNVAAIVIDGPEPTRALLGMSFLGQLEIQHTGERMELKQKY